MINNEADLGIILIVILLIFTLLIYFLLKARRHLQIQDLQLDPETVWKSVSKTAADLNLSKANMIFGVFHDVSSTEISLAVKDMTNQVVSEVVSQPPSRKRTFDIGNQKFLIEFPLTWNRTAILRSLNDSKILARYEKGIFDVSDYGQVDLKTSGIKRNILSLRNKGKLVILPADLPLHAKIFILAV